MNAHPRTSKAARSLASESGRTGWFSSMRTTVLGAIPAIFAALRIDHSRTPRAIFDCDALGGPGFAGM